MVTQVQIGTAGEKIVNSYLIGKGYSTNLDTRQPGSTDIEAGNPVKLLVQVKTAMSPSQPAELSSDEMRNIKSRAARLGCEAWSARVTVDSNLNLKGDIQWKRLDS